MADQPQPRRTMLRPGIHPALRRAAARASCSATGSTWSTTARAAGCTSNASRATSPARSRSTSSSSAACSRSCSSRSCALTIPDLPIALDARGLHPDRRARADHRVSVLEDDLGRGRSGVPAAAGRQRSPRRADSPHLTQSSLAQAGQAGGRRSTVSVRTPSTNSHVASPTIAKSWKSSCACSMKRCRSGPATGGSGRDRTAVGASRNRCEHRVDVELIVWPRRYDATSRRATSTRGRPARSARTNDVAKPGDPGARSTTASAWCGAISHTSTARRGAATRAHAIDHVLERLESGRAGHERAARLVVDDLGRQVGDLGRGDVRRVRRPSSQPAAQLARAARRTRSPSRDAHPASPRTRRRSPRDRQRVARSHRSPTPRRRGARPRARARSRPSRCRGRRPRRRDRPVDERGRSPRPAQPDPLGFLERDLDDPLGLGPRDQHPRDPPCRSSPRNDHAPSTYWSGSPRTRRSHMRRSRDLGACRRGRAPRRRATPPRRSPTPLRP